MNRGTSHYTSEPIHGNLSAVKHMMRECTTSRHFQYTVLKLILIQSLNTDKNIIEFFSSIN